MKQRFKNTEGFTLIELIMVIVILGILAAVAIPQFTDLSASAAQAAEDGVVGGIRAGIATVQAGTLAGGGAPPGYPTALDGIVATPVDCSAAPVATSCFDTVLAQGGIRASEWRKTGAFTYEHFHIATNTSTYIYTPGTGSFTCGATCP